MEPVLKVFGSESWHGSVTIIGNVESLKKLRDSIDEAIQNEYSNSLYSESDGEYYNLEVVLVNDSDIMDSFPNHYTDNISSTKDKKKWDFLYSELNRLSRNYKIDKLEREK